MEGNLTTLLIVKRGWRNRDLASGSEDDWILRKLGWDKVTLDRYDLEIKAYEEMFDDEGKSSG